MSDNQGSSNKIVVLIVGVVVGIAIGLGIAMVMDEGGTGPRGEWHDSPSPQTSPDRTVTMNLTAIQQLNDASNATQNPQKDLIAQKLLQITDPGFLPADRVGAAIRAHTAWKFATKGIWASVHEELIEIN